MQLSKACLLAKTSQPVQLEAVFAEGSGSEGYATLDRFANVVFLVLHKSDELLET
jgi:hypothetical protein